MVMKESQHPNIVNFLESYLVKSQELWVVMEYMEGGALTDIIENNSLEEDQISSICFEVRRHSFGILVYLTSFFRHAKDWAICTVNPSSIVILNQIMSFWILRAA